MSKAKSNRKNKLLFVSSCGGHFEELMMLRPLMCKYESVVITEKSPISNEADYFIIKTSHKDKYVVIKIFINMVKAVHIWIKENPTHIITTGAMAALPFALLAKLTCRKIIFIETFARISDTTKTGKLLYKHSDLFIVQWKLLLAVYPNAVYGGSIF